jgi:uncharacterized caspase-like protein
MRSTSLVGLIFAFALLSCSNCKAQSFALPEGYIPKRLDVGKYALVIGVEEYISFSHVENAINDSKAVAAALNKAHFNFVRYLPNPETADSILDAIKELKQQTQSGDRPALVVVYFAGHGFQARGHNFLVPKNALEASLIEDSLDVVTLLSRVKPDGHGVAVVFLDACRTVRVLDADNSSASLSAKYPAGFSGFPEFNKIVVELSTSPGRAAQSVSNFNREHSPFSSELEAQIPRQSLSLDALHANISRKVEQDTAGLQVPVIVKVGALTQLYMRPGPSDIAAQDAAWQEVAASNYRRNCLRDYLALYPTGAFSSAATYLIELQNKVSAPDSPCELNASK